MAIKAILFDIDGTLLKCFGAGKKALVRACREVFGTVGMMQYVDFQGKTDPLILRESLSTMGFDDVDIERNTDALKERYFRHLAKYMSDSSSVLMPGVGELLDALSRTESVLLGLLTGNFRESARIKLGHFDLNRFFPFGVFGDDATYRNDMPPIAKRILNDDFGLDIPFGDIVIIGDTVYDIECAKRSGAVAVAVGTGWADRESLIARGPDFFFEDLADPGPVIDAILA